jgi:hypothetical protein
MGMDVPMPSTLFGLPTHILLLHVVVVLLPIVAALTVVIAVWTTARERFGVALVAVTFLVTLFVPLTTQAGEDLLSRLPETPARTHHGEIGQQVLVVTAIFGVALALMVFLDLLGRASTIGTGAAPPGRLDGWFASRVPPPWRERRPAWFAPAFLFARGAAVASAVAVTVWVVMAGHTGASATWSHYPGLK